MTEEQKQLNEQIRILTFAKEGWGIEEKTKCEKSGFKPKGAYSFDFCNRAYRVVLPPLPEEYRLLEFGEKTSSRDGLVIVAFLPDSGWFVSCNEPKPTADAFWAVRKIEFKQVPLEQSDWMTSPVWWVRESSTGAVYSVTGFHLGKVQFDRVWMDAGDKVFLALERSTDLKTWAPCWKEVEV